MHAAARPGRDGGGGCSGGEAAADEVVMAMSSFREMVKQGKAGADREAGPQQG